MFATLDAWSARWAHNPKVGGSKELFFSKENLGKEMPEIPPPASFLF